jgi:hypothetical protein
MTDSREKLIVRLSHQNTRAFIWEKNTHSSARRTEFAQLIDDAIAELRLPPTAEREELAMSLDSFALGAERKAARMPSHEKDEIAWLTELRDDLRNAAAIVRLSAAADAREMQETKP